MSDEETWAFPEAVQPNASEVQFDLERAYDSVVLIRAEIPEDATSAANLGTERAGYGAVIREDGLVVTIGYLINEATQIWLTTNRGVSVAGHPLAYDHMTGFGLVQPLGKLPAPHLTRGLAADVSPGDAAFAIGHGGAEREAKRLGTEFLGALPLKLAIRELADEGTPIAAARPDSEEARIYHRIAARLWEKLSGTQARAAPAIVME